MIKGISLQNFMSFDDIDLDLTDKGGRCMNHAFIYGENGSGKTNLIDSLMFLEKSTMTLLNEKNGGDEDEPLRKLLSILKEDNPDFKLKSNPKDVGSLASEYRMIGADGNMAMRFSFEIDGHDATYRLEFDDRNVIQSESLDYIISKKKGNLFRITRDEVRLQKNLVSVNYRRELNELLDRYWGKHTFIAILAHESNTKNEEFFSSEISSNIRSFLQYLVSMVVIKRDESCLPLGRSTKLPVGRKPSSEIAELDRIQGVLSKFFSRLYSDIKSVHFLKENINDDTIRYELYFDKRIAGKIRSIPAEAESSGTKRLMCILPFLLMCADGMTVVIDEIDTEVHDLLMSQLMSQCIPDITGQLLATTHNTSLMTYKDAPNIFIISIDRKGFKQIASIQATEPPNVKTNVQKRYLEGYYSGVPYVADIGLRDILEASKMKESE